MSNPIYLLLYSGGVDSILCLKKLIDKGITPFIFHFWTRRLKKIHEKMIRKTARALSPKSPFYVFKTNTDNFGHGLWDNHKYYVEMTNHFRIFPIWHGDFIVTGVMKHIYEYGEGNQGYNRNRWIIKKCEIYNLPYLFPLADYTREQTDQEFQQLPLNIRQNTVSTTRNYNYGGGIFVQRPT